MHLVGCLTLVVAMLVIASGVQAARPLDLRDLSVDVQRSLMSA